MTNSLYISSVIRQKGETHNGCFKKRKHAKFSKFSVRVRIRGLCSFFRKFGVRCFLETPVLRFALLSYYRRFKKIFSCVTATKLISGNQLFRKSNCSKEILLQKKYPFWRSSRLNEVPAPKNCMFWKVHFGWKNIYDREVAA